MSLLRTSYRQQRLFKCNLNRAQTQYNGDTHIPIRGLKNLALGYQFRILFMGRDEFSCLVLEELFKARGMSHSQVEFPSDTNFFLKLI